MTEPSYRNKNPIDAVITWVNGTSPVHRRRRMEYMAKADAPLHENAANPHRWEQSDEILFCIQSIINHAPWIRVIWIVSDGDRPDLSNLAVEVREKIRFADHEHIFRGFDDVLPTFNSLAIESMLWRIEGLAERFVYFNDDVFLTAPITPEDVFSEVGPVLRGGWTDLSALVNSSEARRDPAMFHKFMQINAAQLAGFHAQKLFAAAHVVHPMMRSVMSELFEELGPEFRANISHRFRALSQFLPQGLHNHRCLAQQNALICDAPDHLHIVSGYDGNGSPNAVGAMLRELPIGGTKFLCINDLPQLERLEPAVRSLLEKAIGGFSSESGPRINEAFL